MLTYDNKIQFLGTRWDRRCHDAQDLSTIEYSSERLSELSKVGTTVDTSTICELTCFSEPAASAELLFAFSDLAGRHLEPVFIEYIDSSSNYQVYRPKLHKAPSLAFLYPFVVDLKWGNR